MAKGEGGFTLVETLLVFSIFLLVSSLAAVYIVPQASRLESRLFLSQLQSDLFFAQQYAISRQETISFYIFQDENRYIATPPNSAAIIDRSYEEDIAIYEDTMKLSFRFLPSGNVSSFGSLYAEAGGETYRITFLIGKGRFYIVKE
ncbi:competence type IV pilus minor pilin ComGD [Bacillus sp. UMB0728]|uniref:competence type IV pilus minor pilin ComGD n=1 Tax=Bacillus sp. UMB0728 TaxID=2066052 RepID=UPI000C757F01|nr:competence type IV pilus minor pilin ComGD [Bacillus sp. UMB0728]PLR72605.1 competence protein ComG [Bacillus sp. UMB0728]